MIQKGTISSVDENKKTAIVIPMDAKSTVTFALVVPYFLWECLDVGMEVVYCTFEDLTGIILSRLDGEWNHTVYETLTVKGVQEITKTLDVGETVTAQTDVIASGISLVGHVHGGIYPGSSNTSTPQ